MKLDNTVFFLFLIIIIFITQYYTFSKNTQNFDNLKQSVKVIYTPSKQQTDGELDFIQNDICKDREIVFVPLDNLVKYVKENPQLVNNHILVFSSNDTKYDELLQIVIEIKPLIIIHLSDERGDLPEYTYITSKTKYVFRQYNFKDYKLNYYNNLYHIPIGYTSKMLKTGESSINRKDIRPAAERRFTWSFIGNMSQDRVEMIDKFTENFPSYYKENTEPNQSFEIYNNSIFVLYGQDNVSINCVLVYEAALSGAIPVVVGNWNDELKYTFNLGNHDNIVNYNNIPPFIYEETWDDAVDRCKWLLDNPEVLQKIQDDILKWWNNIVTDMQQTINKIVDEHVSASS
jgi:hypothetical protein